MKISFIGIITLLSAIVAQAAGPFFANGLKTGEVDQDSAIVWVRLTQNPEANFSALPILTEGLGEGEPDKGEIPANLVPGMDGEVRLTYWCESNETAKWKSTEWLQVSSNNDYIYQIPLTGLEPGSTYNYIGRARNTDSGKVTALASGKFKTAPAANEQEAIRFIVTTCQAIRSIDSGKEGHHAYKQMLSFDPHFFVHTGDIVYYDKAPLSKNVAQARSKWNLMFAYSNNQHFHQNVTSYFIKDDHDTLVNDCWPGQTYFDLTFEQGLSLFREQVPMGEKTYRTIRWGKDVQVWLTENRDFRSPNTIPDGPDKTILGATQKAWLKRTMKESDATYKFVITPGPIVGPDKPGKADNHSNDTFFSEGQELRNFLKTLPNTYVITGDRHWQYCSVDPKTGVVELGCGPINDEHNYGGNPGYDPEFHRYFDGGGGFLGITVEDGTAIAEWFAINPENPTSPVPMVRKRMDLGSIGR